MPAMSYNAQVALNATNADVFAASTFHTAERPSRYRLYGRHAAAVGTVVASVRHGRYIDGEQLLMAAAAGAPVMPDDWICDSVLMPGESYKVDLLETAGVNTITQLRVVIEEG